MNTPTLLELAESGAHFGHHRSMLYPKARDFVYMVKNNVALINLEKTQEAIEQAKQVIAEHQKAGKVVLFVGTKRSVRSFVKEVAESIEAPYIVERWFGGTLTNFSTILDSIKRMNELEKFLASEDSQKLTKKDRLSSEQRFNRYHRFLGGIAGLTAMPDLIVLASASEDYIAVEEANQLDIPVIAITDTDMNPEKITYPIPANDDAPKAVELILHAIVQEPTKVSVKNEESKAEKEIVTAEEAKPQKTVKAKAAPKKVIKKPAKKAVAKVAKK